MAPVTATTAVSAAFPGTVVVRGKVIGEGGRDLDETAPGLG
jgi:hypothetical protein